MQEAKFTTPQSAISMSQPDAVKLLTTLMHDLFGNVHTLSYTAELNHVLRSEIDKREITMEIENSPSVKTHDDRTIQLPSVSINFDWDLNGSAVTNNSDKSDADSYRIEQKPQKESFRLAQIIRDKIIRVLARHAILINFIPVGSRRSNWYKSILSSSGFYRIPGFVTSQYWAPVTMPGLTKWPMRNLKAV